MDEMGDEGFTLIELLVVIIIIGILAAIAIPNFLSQRNRGYDAAAKSELRNAANFEEVYLSDFATYGTVSQLTASSAAIRPSHNVTVTVVTVNGQFGYCLSSVDSRSGHVWFYDSQGGGLQPRSAAACPVTTTGVAGGSVSG